MRRVASPSRLGRYPVRRRLGAGAFATVWLAYDEQLDSPVAIKVLADNWTADHHVRQRFIEEGRFLRKVSSPHVVTVYDAGELDDERPFLVMSYADQGTLADRLELAPLSSAQALHVICQVGQGLHALHRRGVLHRDVKPANVLFRTDDSGSGSRTGSSDRQVCAMLGDLGLGKAMDMSSRLTVVGGTPSYVSPEQARGEGLDPRSDQYSLAALAWLLLAGRPPYAHTTLGAAADPEPPPPLDGDVPPEVEAVLRRALRVDRDGRYPDVPAFTGALAAAMGGLDAHPPEAWIPVDPDLTQPGARPSAYAGDAGTLPPVRSPRRRRRWPWAAAAVLALVAGAGAGYGAHEWLVADTEIDDATGTLSVIVPEAWGDSVQRESWVPPEQDVDFPALSAGSVADWQDGEGEGVFVGLLPGNDLPERLPQHPECDDQRPVVTDEQDGDVSMTAHWSGCDGGMVAVERVVRVTSSQLLWVQVRAADGGTANQVLDAVSTHGM